MLVELQLVEVRVARRQGASDHMNPLRLTQQVEE